MKTNQSKVPQRVSRRLVIENFGAVKNIDIHLNTSLHILIGPQASGKSTIGKLIYFCRSIREYLVEYTRIIWKRNNGYEAYTNFLKYLQNPFMGCFGTTKHMDNFFVKYYYDENEDKFISISLDPAHYARFQFSASLKMEVEGIIQEAISVMELPQIRLIDVFDRQERFLALYRETAKSIFSDDEKLLYIPAGRNLLATIPDLVMPPEKEWEPGKKNLDISQIDLITQEFIKHIRGMREEIGDGLVATEERYLKTVQGQIKNKDVELARELIHKILKAEYRYENGVERLYYEENKWMKLMFSSSGQQEILWALNSIFISILHQEKTFFIFEEPEAHIFPDAQELVMRLIALLLNSNRSEVFLTTHSPYILTATNLLLFSGKEERKDTSIIEKSYRIAPNSVSSYFVLPDTGELENIVSSKRKLIDALKIDQISDSINSKMNEILRIQHSGKKKESVS